MIEKLLNPFQTAEAAKSFDSLYQRYVETVYLRGLAALTNSDKTSEAMLEQFIVAFDELTSRTAGY